MMLGEEQLTKQNLLQDYYQHTSEKIIFIDKYGKVIDMNPAAKEVTSPDNNYSQITQTLCNHCSTYTEDYDLHTCEQCFLKEEDIEDATFQVYLRTTEDQFEPFTASYEMIDEEKEISAFTLQNVSQEIVRKEKVYQRTMMKKTIAAQENERKRISRELHDSVVQEMLNVDVELRLLKYQQSMEELTSSAERIEGLMSQLIDDIRHLSVELRPSSLDDLGLDAAFKTYFKQAEANYGVYIDYETNLNAKRYNNTIETVVYRVVQEAVFNAIKYADVSKINVTLHEVGQKLIAEVVDHGKGFDKSHQPQGTGLGLYGMNERAELIDAEVMIDTQLGRGNIVTLEVPI